MSLQPPHASWQRHYSAWLARTLKHECVCACYLPIGTSSSLMGGFWLWGSEMWSSSWALLCRGLQSHHVPRTCANGLGSPYCYCAQQVYPYMHIDAPSLHLLNLSLWFTLPQITRWDSCQGCMWLIAIELGGLRIGQDNKRRKMCFLSGEALGY